jgi:hypothetical protein
MASAFIKNWVVNHGMNDGSWHTLDGVVQRVGLLGDANIHIDPTTRVFYFDNDNELLYIKNLTGTLYDYEKSKQYLTTTGYMSFTLKDGTKVVAVESSANGVSVTGLGRVHTFISYDNISGFYNEGLAINDGLQMVKDLVV